MCSFLNKSLCSLAKHPTRTFSLFPSHEREGLLTTTLTALWTSLLSCNSGVPEENTVPTCSAAACDPPAMNEMSAFPINSTHALMCGGFVAGNAYLPTQQVNTCWIFNAIIGRFESRIGPDSTLTRSSAALWVNPNQTQAYFWSGGTPSGDRSDMVKFPPVTGAPAPTYPFYFSFALPSPHPIPVSLDSLLLFVH